jgi:signal peptidase I
LKNSHLVREIIEVVALAVLIFVVIHFVIQSYHVSGTNMQPSFSVDQYVMVNKSAYLFRTIERGDVVVFHNPRDTNQDFIERVVGLPGDTIQIDSTTIKINGTLLNEPYVKVPTNPLADSWKVPANQYFVLNDNRQITDDSRAGNFVPKDYIIGKAILVYWPLNNLQFVDTHTNVFTQVKAGN